MTGRVILVGAGPGDPELVTLRGANALRAADAVLYDELAAPELLALAPARAERINVGKRGHDAPTRSQAEINELLVERARSGQYVVRLKGGDPFVFGRGGEEASACVEAGVEFEVVPGVSSAIAAPAYAGIPLTDRRHAASFAVVTGHKDPTRVSEETRWAELGRAVDTLVILMGMQNLPGLVAKLVAGGKPGDTPAAAITHGTLGTQRALVTTLADLPQRVQAAGFGAPSAVVIGSVVSLRETLAWWERAPLFGLRVLVTRAPEQAGAMAGALRAHGAEPVLAPMIRFAPPQDSLELDAAFERLGTDGFDALVFSSANAVEAFLARGRERGVAPADLATRIICVGPQTARAALDAGLAVHLVPPTFAGGGDAEALLAELRRHLPPRGLRFLLPRSQIGRDVLERGLRESGAEVCAVTAYQTLPPEGDPGPLRAELASGGLHVLTFTSPSTVRHLVERLDAPARAAAERCLIGAVGPTTARALRSAGFEPDVVPARPDAVSLVEALAAFAQREPERVRGLREPGSREETR